MQYYFQGLERRTGQGERDNGDSFSWDNCFIHCTLSGGYSPKGVVYGNMGCSFKIKADLIDQVFGMPLDDLIKDIELYIGEPVNLGFFPNDKGGFDVGSVTFTEKG